MLWLLDFRWYPVVGGAALLALVFGYWQGHQAADQSAKVEQLEASVAQANDTIAALQENTRRANAAAAAYSQRESQAQEALAETERLIHELEPTPETPVADICALRDADLQRLRNIAARASGHRAAPGRAPLDIRPARGSAASP